MNKPMNNPTDTSDNAQTPAVNAEDINQESAEMSMEGLFAAQDEFRKKLNSKEILKVKVIQVNNDYVFVDIGEKKEGLIPVSDFGGERTIPQPGTEVSAVLEKRGGEDRHAILSHQRAMESLGWEQAQKGFEEKTRVKGTILECVKGGYIVDVFAIRAFMPLSLSELHPAYKHHLPSGAKIRCQIVELAREKRRVIVSRKQVLDEEENSRRDKVLGVINAGDVLRVVVAKVGKDVLYLRYHGIEGIVRAENVSWKNHEEALKTYRRGQRLKAKLITIDKNGPKLEFGLKQLYPNPAELLRRKYKVRTVVNGKVLSCDENGVRISVGPDVEGTIPAMEIAPEVVYQPGEAITAVVMGVNQQDFTLNLSVRRFEDIQNRKVIDQYMKSAPPLTLGQLLANGLAEKNGK